MRGVHGAGDERRPGPSVEGRVPAATGRSRLREALAAATERVEEIIDAAERVAEGIYSDAEGEAERYLTERRREADRLAEEQRERLERVLETIRERLARLESEGRELVAEVERALEAAGTPAAEARAAGESTRGGGGPAAGVGDAATGEMRERALIRATQMAVGGAGRDRIEAALRDELGIADAASIVDEVLRR